MNTKKKERCVYSETRGGKLLRCERGAGHAGDHEVQDAPPPPPERTLRLKVPVKPEHVYAYLLGAADFATGLGLDRLAQELQVPPRKKDESDHDLSLRVRAHVRLPR